MLIDTQQIITKTELRENLTNILLLVKQGQELMISDRGRIEVKLVPIKNIKEKESKQSVDKFMAGIEKLGKRLSRKNPHFNSVKALREVRNTN